MNKEQWNQFIIKNNGSFLQSWPWGAFQESLGRKIWRIEADRIKALVIKHDLPFKKNYLYCPRCIIAKEYFNNLLEKVNEIANQEKSIFFKIEPESNLELSGFKLSKKQIQPKKTIILDLHKSEEELLGQMHQKTRYNIRLAQKKGLIIKEAGIEKIDVFLKLSEQTAKRDKFFLHPKEYYRKMMEVLGSDGIVKLFLAKHNNKIMAANLICFFGKTAIYLHGASDYSYRNLMAPYLLQWEVIKQAKANDFQYYDFGGINEKKWPGVTRFKQGFSGQEISYPGAFDLIFQPIWYRIYNLSRRIL